MPQGIQIFDENGGTSLDTSGATGIIIGVVTVLGKEIKQIVNPEFSVSRPFSLVVATKQSNAGDNPEVTFSGNTLTVTGMDDNSSSGTYYVYYGVY